MLSGCACARYVPLLDHHFIIILLAKVARNGPQFYSPGVLGQTVRCATKNIDPHSPNYQARAQSARARRACALRALGLLLADGTPTVGGGKTF